jgi:hypothetical protein
MKAEEEEEVKDMTGVVEVMKSMRDDVRKE